MMIGSGMPSRSPTLVPIPRISVPSRFRHRSELFRRRPYRLRLRNLRFLLLPSLPFCFRFQIFEGLRVGAVPASEGEQFGFVHVAEVVAKFFQSRVHSRF
jgi:hypothetical protein